MTTHEAIVSTREGMDNGHNGQQKIYEMLTSEIVSIIEEKKELPWRSDFTGFSMPKNLKSGKEYSGTNRLLLMLAQTLLGYSSPYWLTFKQVQEMGGQVKKGERGTTVVYWNIKEVNDEHTWTCADCLTINRCPFKAGEKDQCEIRRQCTGMEVTNTKEIPFIRYYKVFNLNQTTIEFSNGHGTLEFNGNVYGRAREIWEHMGDKPEVRQVAKTSMSYSPRTDTILEPPAPQLGTEQARAEHFLHELIHSTGHPKRLHRFELDEPLNGREKSEEELTAELGMVFICAHEGLPCDKTNSAAYCLGWAEWLREHPKAIVFAANRAEKAVKYIYDA